MAPKTATSNIQSSSASLSSEISLVPKADPASMSNPYAPSASSEQPNLHETASSTPAAPGADTQLVLGPVKSSHRGFSGFRVSERLPQHLVNPQQSTPPLPNLPPSASTIQVAKDPAKDSLPSPSPSPAPPPGTHPDTIQTSTTQKEDEKEEEKTLTFKEKQIVNFIKYLISISSDSEQDKWRDKLNKITKTTKEERQKEESDKKQRENEEKKEASVKRERERTEREKRERDREESEREKREEREKKKEEEREREREREKDRQIDKERERETERRGREARERELKKKLEVERERVEEVEAKARKLEEELLREKKERERARARDRRGRVESESRGNFGFTDYGREGKGRTLMEGRERDSASERGRGGGRQEGGSPLEIIETDKGDSLNNLIFDFDSATEEIYLKELNNEFPATETLPKNYEIHLPQNAEPLTNDYFFSEEKNPNLVISKIYIIKGNDEVIDFNELNELEGLNIGGLDGDTNNVKVSNQLRILFERIFGDVKSNDNSSVQISKIIILFKNNKEEYYYYIIEDPPPLSGGAPDTPYNEKEFNKYFLDFYEELKDEKDEEIQKRIKEIKGFIKEIKEIKEIKSNDEGEQTVPLIEKIIDNLFDIINLLKKEQQPTISSSEKTGSFDLDNKPEQSSSNNIENPIDLTNITKNLEKIVIYIYDVILGIIILICIIIAIIHIFNILKFLYKCFIEIGSVEHSNLLTKDTFRYKLLEYITYIDNSSLPGLINNYNNPTTGTEQVIKFSNIIKDFYSSSKETDVVQTPSDPTEKNTAETIINKLGEDTLKKIKDKYATKRKNNNDNDENENMNEWDKLTAAEKLEYIHNYQPKIAKFINDNYNKVKEPIFNIFLTIRLIFICFKFFITFIMILVLSVILYIVTQIVDSNSGGGEKDMFSDPTFIQILKASGICFIYLIVNIILYKTMFIKIYDKMLHTYLNVICIDISLNEIKKGMSHQHAMPEDTPDISLLFKNNKELPPHTHEEFFNDDFIELIKDKIDDDDKIKQEIQDKISKIARRYDDEHNKDNNMTEENLLKHYVKEITGMIIIYVLIKHIHNGHNKIKGSTDKVFNYFIKDKELDVNDEEWKTFKYDKSFYGLIPNNYRKVPIPYFKYNWGNIDDKTVIDKSNEILISVNDKITKLNQYISDANNYIDDDNYLVNIGWYFLSNLFISSILIILIIYILKDTFTTK